MEELLEHVVPWARNNLNPVNNIIFRCFLHIKENTELLARYEMLIVTRGATHRARQYVNQRIAREIRVRLGSGNSGRRHYLPKGKYLINSYTILN